MYVLYLQIFYNMCTGTKQLRLIPKKNHEEETTGTGGKKV